MKRPIAAAIVSFTALLLAGWLGFEWFVDDRLGAGDGTSSAVDSSQGPAPLEGETEKPVPDGDELRNEGRTKPAGSGIPSAFDWRRAAEDHASADRSSPLRAVEPAGHPPAVGSDSGRRSPVTPVAGQPSPPVATPERKSPNLGRPEATEPATNPQRSLEREVRDDPSEDIRPPDLEWVRFDPVDVVGGQETTLSASAVDDLAGVREIVGRISSPSGNAHLGFALSFNSGSGTWDTMMRVPDKAESGRWQISWLRLTDKANNSKDERWGSNGVPGSFLLVSSPEGDGDPPVLRSVTLDRTTMGQGETVQVTVDVTDDQSGVRFVSGTFQSPSGRAWAPFTTTGQGSVWSGPVTVPEDGECGEWTLRRLTAIDEANNQATWGAGDERIAGIKFYRSFTGSCDSEPPVLTRFELSPRFVGNESPSQIQLTAFIEDVGSGVATASGFAMVADQAGATPQRVHFVLRASSDAPGSPWIGTAEIPRHSMAGRWEIRALRISDQARNQKTYGMSDPAMAEAWFVVE